MCISLTLSVYQKKDKCIAIIQKQIIMKTTYESYYLMTRVLQNFDANLKDSQGMVLVSLEQNRLMDSQRISKPGLPHINHTPPPPPKKKKLFAF